ncbi:hypothetical protein FHT78_005158 [Rhizobium sp. BK196]|nr:hypothetical protein [Rhizobium sp. BK196]
MRQRMISIGRHVHYSNRHNGMKLWRSIQGSLSNKIAAPYQTRQSWLVRSFPTIRKTDPRDLASAEIEYPTLDNAMTLDAATQDPVGFEDAWTAPSSMKYSAPPGCFGIVLALRTLSFYRLLVLDPRKIDPDTGILRL